MATCTFASEERAELLLDYVAGTLSSSLNTEVERHLEACPSCRTVVKSQREVWSSLDDWEPVPVSADFDRKLYARLGEAENGGFWQQLFALRWSSGRWKVAVMPFAAACIMLFAAFMLRFPVAKTPEPVQSAARVESADVEQVERTLADLDMLRQLSGSPGSTQEIQ